MRHSSVHVAEFSVLRSVEEVEKTRDVWEAAASSPDCPPPHPWTDYDYFTSRVVGEPGFIRPHVLVLREGDRVGIVPARIVEERIRWQVGGKTLLSSRARVLRVSNGGMIGLGSAASAGTAIAALRAALASGDADILYLHEVENDSAFAAAARAVPFFARDQFARMAPSYALDVPASYDDFLRSRPTKTRTDLRSALKRVNKALKEPRFVRYDRPEDLERIVADCNAIAALAYQRELGVGFRDDPETRAMTTWALQRGWLCAHVLYDGDKPVAFSHELLYRGTLHGRDTGYDPQYASCRPGTALLVQVIEESCANPAVKTFNFGVMESNYKRKLATSCSELVSMYVFAPTARGLLMKAKRTVTGMADRLARSALGAERARRWARRLSRLRR